MTAPIWLEDGPCAGTKLLAPSQPEFFVMPVPIEVTTWTDDTAAMRVHVYQKARYSADARRGHFVYPYFRYRYVSTQ